LRYGKKRNTTKKIKISPSLSHLKVSLSSILFLLLWNKALPRLRTRFESQKRVRWKLKSFHNRFPNYQPPQTQIHTQPYTHTLTKINNTHLNYFYFWTFFCLTLNKKDCNLLALEVLMNIIDSIHFYDYIHIQNIISSPYPHSHFTHHIHNGYFKSNRPGGKFTQ
jgi:hypothetical protein